MRIKLFTPSAMEGRMNEQQEDEILNITPRKYSKAQRMLFVIPFVITNDKGVDLDRGHLTLNAKTGKLGIEHRTKEVPIEADELTSPTAPPAKLSGKPGKKGTGKD